jgi:hypothetical protein
VKKDNEIVARNMFGAALIGLLFSDTTMGRELGVSPALATLIGGILGPIIDSLIFALKVWVAKLNERQFPPEP